MAWKASMTFPDGDGPPDVVTATKEEAENFVDVFKTLTEIAGAPLESTGAVITIEEVPDSELPGGGLDEVNVNDEF